MTYDFNERDTAMYFANQMNTLIHMEEDCKQNIDEIVNRIESFYGDRSFKGRLIEFAKWLYSNGKRFKEYKGIKRQYLVATQESPESVADQIDDIEKRMALDSYISATELASYWSQYPDSAPVKLNIH